MSETKVQMCIYPGCDKPAVPPHELGGPQPHFCEDEDHNAATAHYERQRSAGEGAATGEGDETPA